MSRLPRTFYARSTLEVAVELLGKKLVRIEPDGSRLSGWITETEAYTGEEDLGCHARSGRTSRNDVLWREPGHLYVYFTYGMHWLMNLVTEERDAPAAVLIRAMAADEGRERMIERRSGRVAALTDGPAKICQALAVDGSFNGIDTCCSSARVFVEDHGVEFEGSVKTGPRVGLFTVPEPWKSIEWRFRILPDQLRGV